MTSLNDCGNASRNKMYRGRSRANEAGGTEIASEPSKRSYGPQSAPPELLAFVRQHNRRHAAAALGLSVIQVHRIANGIWPSDPRKTLAAWSAYRARSAIWRLRRVHQGSSGGLYVRERGEMFAAPALAGRQGQQILIASQADGLLAQTIDAPVDRFTLVRVPESSACQLVQTRRLVIA